MKKIISSAVTAVLLAQNPALIYAAENAVVKSVRVSADSVYVTTDKPVKYKAFSLGGDKLVLEIEDSRLKTLQEIPVNGVFIKKVRTGQFKTSPVSVTRVVMELAQKAVYEVTQKGTELSVVFGVKQAARPQPLKDAPAAVPAQSAPVKIIPPDSRVKSAAPAAKPVLTLKAADVNRESAPVIAPRTAAARPSGLARNIMDTLSREPISFDYSDADIREVLSMLGAKAGVNMIYAADVAGTITMNLTKVPFDEAFKTVLSVQGLAAQQVGDNILRIATPATLLSEQSKAFLQTRVFFLNYSKAADIMVQVNAVAEAEGRKSSSVMDAANNALIVTDSAMGLETTARLIRSLDRVPKQVVIEAKLVEVSLDSSFDMGVNWGYSSLDSKGRYVGMNDSNNSVMVNGVATPFPSRNDTGVNLTSKNIYGGLRLGRIGSNYILDIAIQAAAKKGKAKVLSDPKVATLNNKEATINITNQLPYDTAEVTTTNGVAATTYKTTYVTTGIILKVTPTINSDGRITMKINPSVSQPSTASGSVAPAVDTRSTDTNVIVRDGETIVIGGLIHDSQSDAVYKVPLFGDIPLIGALFRKKSTSRSRMELLIFVTPKIMED
ncbi:MAG: hypothetical protein A3J79_07295 [Elusimicrobia bacterium RIFOXYB2_FULL_62_6]|nr:MAG: hypothetical protein A3J79_07295 [Elusimicrobia bacterium RIFOXYB2_FULL_62_6]